MRGAGRSGDPACRRIALNPFLPRSCRSIEWHVTEGDELALPEGGRLTCATVRGEASDVWLTNTLRSLRVRKCNTLLTLTLHHFWPTRFRPACCCWANGRRSTSWPAPPALRHAHASWRSKRQPRRGRAAWPARGKPLLAFAWWRSTPCLVRCAEMELAGC